MQQTQLKFRQDGDVHQGSGHTGLTATPANDEICVNYGKSAELSFKDGIGIAPKIVELA